MNIKTENESRHRNAVRQTTPNVTRTRALVVGEEPSTDQNIRDAVCAADIEDATFVQRGEGELLLHENKFDVIVINASPLLGDDAKLLKKIRESGFNQNTPIIMISADQRPGALSEAFEAGANFFVYKPIDKLHLISLFRVSQGAIEDEKRRFRRVAVRTKVRVGSGDREVEGVTIDVSPNGVLIEVSRTFPLGSVVEVSLYNLAGMQPVVGNGTVVRVLDDNHMGIQFERLPVEDSGRLQEYLLRVIAEQ